MGIESPDWIQYDEEGNSTSGMGMSSDDAAQINAASNYGQGWSPEDTISDFNFSDSGSSDWNTIEYGNGTQGYMWDQGLEQGNFNPQNYPNMALGQEYGGGVSNFLSKLWSGTQNSIGDNPDKWMGGLAKLYAASQEKKRNSDLARRLQANSQSPAFDPFGSQRPQYQQELARAIQDPYSSPIVAQQVRGIQEAQARKDAQAGRRSNSATSSPAMMEAQAKVAQNYINSLYQPAGAMFGPNGSALASMYTDAAKYGTQGNAPYMSALGSILQGNRATADSDRIIEALKAALAK